jgi:hypothetical protein
MVRLAEVGNGALPRPLIISTVVGWAIEGGGVGACHRAPKPSFRSFVGTAGHSDTTISQQSNPTSMVEVQMAPSHPGKVNPARQDEVPRRSY